MGHRNYQTKDLEGPFRTQNSWFSSQQSIFKYSQQMVVVSDWIHPEMLEKSPLVFFYTVNVLPLLREMSFFKKKWNLTSNNLNSLCHILPYQIMQIRSLSSIVCHYFRCLNNAIIQHFNVLVKLTISGVWWNTVAMYSLTGDQIGLDDPQVYILQFTRLIISILLSLFKGAVLIT